MASNIGDYGPLLKVLTISLLVPTSVIFFWRMISKITRERKLAALGVDDVMLILAMILAWLNATCALLAVDNGFGRAGSLLSIEQKKKAMFFFWLFQIDYKFQVMFSKLAVLFFYCHIFSADRTFDKCTRYFMGLIVIASIAFGTANIFQCTPVQRAWNRKLVGTCFNNEIYWISHAVFHVSTDMIIFFMPIIPISKLNMSSSRKLAVIGAFALGSVVCVADCVRIYYLKVSGRSTDPTHGAGMAVIMTVIVQYLSMICLCLVTGLRKSIVTCCQRIRDKKDTKRSGYQLSDFQSSNVHNTANESWPKSQNRIMAGRTTSEERIMDLDDDSSSDGGKHDRKRRDILVKTTFGTTVSTTDPHNRI